MWHIRQKNFNNYDIPRSSAAASTRHLDFVCPAQPWRWPSSSSGRCRSIATNRRSSSSPGRISTWLSSLRFPSGPSGTESLSAASPFCPHDHVRDRESDWIRACVRDRDSGQLLAYVRDRVHDRIYECDCVSPWTACRIGLPGLEQPGNKNVTIMFHVDPPIWNCIMSISHEINTNDW